MYCYYLKHINSDHLKRWRDIVRKAFLYLIGATLILSGCDSKHLEYLWTERHPVPPGTYTPPPVQQLQRSEQYFSTYPEIEPNLMQMREALPQDWGSGNKYYRRDLDAQTSLPNNS